MNKKVVKPDTREYTFKIIPHHNGKVRSIRIPIKMIKVGVATLAATFVFVTGAFCYNSYNTAQLKHDKVELEKLRQVNSMQQTQLSELAKKTATLQTEIEKMDQLEIELRQMTTTEGNTSRGNISRPNITSGGQGGLTPTVENLNAIVDNLQVDFQQRKQNLEYLKNVLAEKQAQVAVTPSIWPASGDVSSRFGWRWGGSDFHPGIDIANNIGTPIVATADGTVVESGWNSGGYGYLVKISHSNGIETLYAHNSDLVVSAGTVVKKGQVIAYMGNTGFSTGPHLHYEVRVNGTAVNPDKFL